ncbi:MAG: hypothetical protein K8U57_16235 [Planctomycetes bacterium]|nr:hypothetical protein [Planctomycetota bacterium]
MTKSLPAELFIPDGVWLIAFTPLGEELTAIIRQVVRTGEVESAYLPVFTSLEKAQQGIAWLAPNDPDQLVAFSFRELERFKRVLNALGLLGHAYIVLDPKPDHKGERITIRDVVKAMQDRLLKPPA